MVKDKVTREDLLNIRVGKSETFTLPTFGHCRSAQSYANQQKNFGMKFTTIIGDPVEGSATRSITITRLQ